MTREEEFRKKLEEIINTELVDTGGDAVLYIPEVLLDVTNKYMEELRGTIKDSAH